MALGQVHRVSWHLWVPHVELLTGQRLRWGVNLLDLISSDPAICHGQACVKGTRIPVSVVLGALADGMSEAEILAEYPTLTVEGVRAAAAYGALLAGEEIVPVHASE